MLYLVSLYVSCFLLLHSPCPSITSIQATVHVIDARFSCQFYWKVQNRSSISQKVTHVCTLSSKVLVSIHMSNRWMIPVESNWSHFLVFVPLMVGCLVMPFTSLWVLMQVSWWHAFKRCLGQILVEDWGLHNFPLPS
jgi:hypothetical protein